jgi:integrase
VPKLFLGWKSEISKSAASIKLEKFLRSGGAVATTALNFSDYWLTQYKPRRKVRWSEPTERGYEMYMNAYLLPEFGAVRLQDIDAQSIASFFDRLRRNHARSVVLKVWTLLQAVLNDAVDSDVLVKNPMRRVPMPKTKLPQKPTLDTDLVPKVLTAVNSSQNPERDSAILHIGIFCAMRAAEIFGLHWSSFHDDHFVIRDSAWKGKLLPDQAKVGERRVFIPPATRAAILRWREQCKHPDLMFASKKGNPLIADNFRKRVLAPLEKHLNLTVPLTFQVLRRSHATRNQKDPKSVQAHFGHKTLTMSLGVYAQEIPEDVRAMVQQDEARVLGKSIATLTATRVKKQPSLKPA